MRVNVYTTSVAQDQMQPKHRYLFLTRDDNIIYGRLRSYSDECSIPKFRVIIDYYSFNYRDCHGYYSVPSDYMKKIWKVIVEFSILPEEVNNIIHEYY